ncbi:MAG: phosphoribosylformylglycinamidine cyclo-ligase [Actinobacteria bacterium 13_1_20CM_2_65_11]|nr:MAG: phosphoribosylformylglycinamidine cyclo-ligase [Chloroflexi bacterium 13_1_40CM_65_17]OLC64628.1 MAG: phosphoribosylformylglycinamidine cyclo-ligase [Actinobacteria bacterium 13_1_40CM_4_65_12]OLD24085.1 MAG: phosphoribosylformylglycinamidine cyclo-ligase [Chloroflexi bacterium 13_1_40CM_3_65_12]OLE78236.1 MAG: phosphoribosylformylglycinamidine cyclo-ligase [Actinobacteria bacterium 13_1_20CM_2_65_11]
MAGEGLSYAAAGVDIEAYERVLARVKPLIAATHGEDVALGVGPFAGLFALPGGGHLAASADGVGTKIKVAIAASSHRGIGIDLVNHCVNDIATAAARPLFFLDYFATGKLDPEVFIQVIEGVTSACREAGCALLGGETAEMPGVYALGDYDLAGFIVGMVEPGLTRDPKNIRAGDVLIGLPSSGLHTNGFSLVRKVFEDVPLDRVFPELGRPLGEELLEPHRSYLQELGSINWKGAAHITGGGVLGNLPRCLPEGLGARLGRRSWDEPPIFGLLSKRGRIADIEMFGTFNMGLGMILVVDRDEVPRSACVVGEVVEQSGGERVVIS